MIVGILISLCGLEIGVLWNKMPAKKYIIMKIDGMPIQRT